MSLLLSLLTPVYFFIVLVAWILSCQVLTSVYCFLLDHRERAEARGQSTLVPLQCASILDVPSYRRFFLVSTLHLRLLPSESSEVDMKGTGPQSTLDTKEI